MAAVTQAAPLPSGSLPQGLVEAIARAATRRRVVLASDFDGTLAPLVDDPASSRPADGAMAALRRAAACAGTTVVLVSGRDLDTLGALAGVEPDEAVHLIGSHGGQSTHPAVLDAAEGRTARQSALLTALDAAVTAMLDEHPGARIERKPAAVVVHTRGLAQPANGAALAAALDIGDRHAGTHVMRGKDVVELSVLSTTKGMALRRLAASVDADATVYLGDDVTDETVFVALDPQAGDVTVKVGAGATAAAARVPGVGEAVRVLELFADDRARR